MYTKHGLVVGLIAGVLLQAFFCVVCTAELNKTFVGSRACADCHEEVFERFAKFAKKSRSFESIEKLRDGLTAEELKQCYSCHTTGYGKPGGFVSLEKTPELKNAGCEACHGPGSAHVDSGDPADIKCEIEMKDCMACHTSERVASFKFKPLIHSGAH